MAQYLTDIVEEDVIKCNVCKKDFIVEELTTEDWNFAWDNYVTKDCCSSCSSKVREEKICLKNMN